MTLVHYHLESERLILKAEFTTLDYLSREEREKVTLFLKETPIVYHWKDSRFETN
jgi:hypothetical protein